MVPRVLPLLVLAACSDSGISVVKSPPAVTITAPAEGAALVEGEPLTLAVRASDRETPTSDLDFSWTLEDGSPVAGTRTDAEDDVSWLVPEGLLEGAHTLTVLVLDGDALSDDDSVSVTVSPPPDPDADGDGFDDAAQGGDDCDDTDADVHPDAAETCDDVDQDCDGDVDEDATDAPTWYADTDADAYGDPLTTVVACDLPDGYVADATDCDDADADVFPGAAEVCNGRDDDCDGAIDEDAIDAATWYADADTDGCGDPATPVAACETPAGYLADATDCDDTDAAEFPGATEVCDGDDDDCDGTVDEDDAADASTWYADADGDGYGDLASTTVACDAPAGYGADATDCDDAASGVHPGAAEVCDLVDQDCDGLVDEGVEATFYADSDGDGYGDAGTAADACSAPSGYVSDDTDCDDGDATDNPAASEVCDGDDDDCDGTADESSAVDADTWYRDADSDGYGVSTSTRVACTRPSGYVSDATDCDDGDSGVSPAATEICEDGTDQDCDGSDPTCPIEGTLTMAEASATVYGASSWLQAGAGVIRCGDLDDDGLDDVMVSGDDSTDYGNAWIFYSEITGDHATSTADVTMTGDAAYDGLALQRGNASGGGDLDGDGSDDLVVGAAGDDLYASNSGTAYVFYGPLGSGTIHPQADADYLWAGATSSDYAANSVAMLGDMTGDAYDELALGAYGQDSGGAVAGAVYVNYGPFTGYRSGGTSLAGSDVTLVGEDAGDYFGWYVADAGDWDGDGLTDVLVGAYSDDTGGSESGAVYVFAGLTSGTVDASAADYKLYGEAAGDRLGYIASGAGDTDGDGYDDIAVGAYKNDDGAADAGAVYVVTGNRTGTRSAGTAVEIAGYTAGDYVGYAVSGGGDVDGDAVPDLVIGAWKNDEAAPDAGAAYVCYGPFPAGFSLSAADATLRGLVTFDYTGSVVNFVGDTDADGLDDFLVGAFGANAGSTSAGEAFLFTGAPR